VWWGGGSYGPRLLLEIVPFLALLATMGWRRACESDSRPPRRAVRVFVVSLAVMSLYAHATGALSWAALSWNATPVPVSHQPSRVWDWRDPQFLAWTDRRAQPRDQWPPRAPDSCPPLSWEISSSSTRATAARIKNEC
jgi:hypothetical protein